MVDAQLAKLARKHVPEWRWRHGIDKAKEQLMKKDIIDEKGDMKAVYAGRNALKKRVTCSKRKENGGILAVGPNCGRRWIRENVEEYKIDLTIDSGAVTTIAPTNTILGQKPR